MYYTELMVMTVQEDSLARVVSAGKIIFCIHSLINS